jgi:hypothetical protein
MKTMRTTGLTFFTATLVLYLTGCGGDVKQAQQQNEVLRAELDALKAQAAEAEAARVEEVKRWQAESRDVAKLRGEVTQLRTTTRDAEKLRTENQRLKNENQQLRGAGAAAAVPATSAAPAPEPGSFPREAWTMAGYASPESALVSAIYSMQQGNPKQYFESLTPEEQLRMTKVWEGKSKEEIAAKHQGDTSKITGMKVLNTQEVSPDQVVMSVYIGGVDRAEKVSMKRVGNEWKFGGFIREPAKP